MRSLWDVPALDEYPSRVPAAVYNLWRRYWMRHAKPLRLPLENLPPMVLELDERLWVCVDASFNDLPVLAWSDFQDAGRALHEPVACTVTQFHFAASAIRNRALEAMAETLARLLA